jgi:hypothetical protein
MSVAKEFSGDLWQNILPKSQSLKTELWQIHVVAIAVYTRVFPDRLNKIHTMLTKHILKACTISTLIVNRLPTLNETSRYVNCVKYHMSLALALGYENN